MKLLGNKVLIQEEKREKTDSGIILPTTPEPVKKGKVFMVGEGKFENGSLIPITLEEGDEVLYQYATQFFIDDKEYALTDASNIILCLNK